MNKALEKLNYKKNGRPHKYPFVTMKVGARFKHHERTIIGSPNIRYAPKHWTARAIGDGMYWVTRVR